MGLRLSLLLALPLLALLTACSQANLLPKGKPVPKANALRIETALKDVDIPPHALGEGWVRIGQERSTTPAFPPRGAFKGVGESRKLEVSFTRKPLGELSLVASEFDTPEDAGAMLEIILISKQGATYTEAKVFGYNGYAVRSNTSKQTGKILALGAVLVSVFSDDARSDEDQERLLRYFLSKLNVPVPKKN